VQHGIACLASLFVLALLTACAALRADINARGQGAPDGAWAIAAALGLGPCTFSLVGARGAPLRIDFHFWGRRWPLVLGASRRPTSGQAAHEPSAWLDSAAQRLRAFGLRPFELVELALTEGRYLEWERLDVELSYGFQDVALTGRTAGALYALAGALPERFQLRQQPIWEASERWEGSVEGSLRLWPGLVLLSVLWYMLRKKAARFGRTQRAQTELANSPNHPS
jgi:hypothetical protein